MLAQKWKVDRKRVKIAEFGLFNEFTDIHCVTGTKYLSTSLMINISINRICSKYEIILVTHESTTKEFRLDERNRLFSGPKCKDQMS